MRNSKMIWIALVSLIGISFGTNAVSELTYKPNESGAGGSITGWPTLENLGGTGRPTQALFVDSFQLGIHNAGLGQDDTGSVWDSGCATGPDAVDDLPCLTSDTASLKISVSTARLARTSAFVTIDGSEASFQSFCRHNTTFAHGMGSASYESIATHGSRGFPIVYREDGVAEAAADIYRLLPFDIGQDLATACQLNDATVNGSPRGQIAFAQETTDDIMVFSADATSRSPYGGRWHAQKVLETDFEDQYPATIGLGNLITNGFQETDCTGGADVTISGVGAVADVSSLGWTAGTNFQAPLMGLGCQLTGHAQGDTVTWVVSSADSGGYYVGQIYLSSNKSAISRDIRFRLQDQAAAVLPAADVAWWITSSVTGRKEKVSVIDPSALVTNELHLVEQMCYGGCLVQFAFRLANDDTGFSLRFEDQSAAPSNVLYDEVWVRRKIYRDLEEHPIIMDGRASFTIISDGLEPVGIENIVDGFDHVLGYATTFEPATDKLSIRPDLYLSSQPSSGVIGFDGELLGNVVGEWDNNLDMAGDANVSRLRDSIAGTHYCISFMGNEDPLGLHGGSAGSRPTSSSLNSDSAANRYLYFLDQVRGFEQAAESRGCIPIVVIPYPQKAHTAQTYCNDATPTTDNCGEWWREMNKNLLHVGI